MKFVLLFSFLLIGCEKTTKPPQKSSESFDSTSTANRYEIVRIGSYECVGMDTYRGGGVWCNKISKEPNER